MRFRPDRSLRVLDPPAGRSALVAADEDAAETTDTVPVIGGSPLRLWRLTRAGAGLLRRLADGDDVVVAVGAPTAALVDRLVDAGALHPDPTSLPSLHGPADVTVVIPVRDRPDELDRLLLSLRSLRDAGAALVVVDDASADGPAHRRVVDDHGARYLRRDRPGGPGAARDDGIVAAATPVVLAVDSDCVVPDDAGEWWDPLLRLLADERVAAVAPRVRTPTGPRLVDRYEAWRSPLDLGAGPARVSPGTRVSYVPAAAMVLRTEVYRSVGGFDPDLQVGEDVDLEWRLVSAGHRIRYEPDVVIHHPARTSLRAWLRQRFGYGTSAALLDRRHPGVVAPVRCSPWSAAGWALVAVGPRRLGPLAGAGVLVASAAALPRRLDDVQAGDAWRLALTGHLGAGRQLAAAVLRAWWPAVALTTLVRSPLRRPARRALAAAVVVSAIGAVVEARWSDPTLGPGAGAAFAVLAVADDMAYGAGVWWGCARTRSARALLPTFPRSAHRF